MIPGKIECFLDAICKIQVWRVALQHLKPDGNWSKHPTLQQWGKLPYEVSLTDATALADYLEAEYRTATDEYLQQPKQASRTKEKASGLHLDYITDQ
jgi:hypothetical protein